jgi:hypothetical protein
MHPGSIERRQGMEKQKSRVEFVDYFPKWIQQRNPEIADEYFKERRKELEILAEDD